MLLSFRPGLLALCPLLIPILFFTWPLPVIDLTVYPFTTVPARLNIMLPSRKAVVSFESCGMSIQLKLLWQCFHIIFFFSQHFSKQIKLRNFEEFWLWPSLAAIMKGLGIYVFGSVLFSSVQFSDKRLLSFRYDKNLKEKVGRLRTD